MSKRKGVHGIVSVRGARERNHGIVVFTVSRKGRPMLNAALVGQLANERETYEKHKCDAIHPKKKTSLL